MTRNLTIEYKKKYTFKIYIYINEITVNRFSILTKYSINTIPNLPT